VERRLLPRRSLPEHWREPDVEVPTPPERREPSASVAAWVDPARAGLPLDDREDSPLVLADLEAAARSVARSATGPGFVRSRPHGVIGVLRASTLPSAQLGLGARGLSILAAGAGPTPTIGAERPSGASLSVHAGAGSSSDVELWLAELRLEGRLDLALAHGQVDLRWCNIGQPGTIALRLAGAEREGPLARRSLPPEPLELRLYGCVVAALEVPPWVRVLAAGCTFDAGSRAAVAIGARGADVRLRHCTIHGALEAGELFASSCVFGGAVRVDRRDRGWLRHCLLPSRGRAPRAYRSLDSVVQFASTSPTSPAYLLLAKNNGVAALANGEHGRMPGAHDARGSRREAEATVDSV
jgi:hypothetical protein